MIARAELPGLRFESPPRRAVASPLRSDVAGFVGRTRRGPVGEAVRVEGMRAYEIRFGGLDQDAPLSYAMRGYFENGGQVAYVVRVADEANPVASGLWPVSAAPITIGSAEDPGPTYRIEATSPGPWAHGLRVSIVYSREHPGAILYLEFNVCAEREPTERFRIALPRSDSEGDGEAEKQALEHEVASKSKLIRLYTGSFEPPCKLIPAAVPRWFRWKDIELKHPNPDALQPAYPPYRQAISLLDDEPEVAIVAMPGLAEDRLLSYEQKVRLVADTTSRAAQRQDRLVLADVIPALTGSTEITRDEVVRFTRALRSALPVEGDQRAAAVYYPWIRVEDPLADVNRPLRTVAPSGHVAGVISRVDRERGAHHTPANVPLLDAVDVETVFDRGAGRDPSDTGANLIRCAAGKGLTVWGGRTLDRSRSDRFVAHRRFIHRLVRTLRAAAEPLVFETHGPELWLVLVRSVTTVLLEAFRGGALLGARPEQAFRVRCDETTNPARDRENGTVACEIALALAAPMEFITIRVSLSREGQVEVFDA